MTNNRILIKEALDTYRLDLCAVQDGDLRERLIRAFDRIYCLLKYDNFADENHDLKELKDEIDDLETEKGDLETEKEDLENELEAKEDTIKKLLRILAYQNESLGATINCVPMDRREQLHVDHGVIDELLTDDLPLDVALRIMSERMEALNV